MASGGGRRGRDPPANLPPLAAPNAECVRLLLQMRMAR
jgi:hypothetical protein